MTWSDTSRLLVIEWNEGDPDPERRRVNTLHAKVAMKRIGIFGWGIVAPECPNINVFAEKLRTPGSWLRQFNGFGRSNFLVGLPSFSFEIYQSWIVERFSLSMYSTVARKMDEISLFAIGAFIQALNQNPGIEKTLQNLGDRAHVYIGTGLGSVATIANSAYTFQTLSDAWDAHWADPENNAALSRYLRDQEKSTDSGAEVCVPSYNDVPPSTDIRAWNRYWARQSPELCDYLDQAAEIDTYDVPVRGDSTPVAQMVKRAALHEELRRKYEAPRPPWQSSEGVFWNLHNTPAAQISILGRITGLSFAPVAACATFGVALRLAMSAIRSGDALAVVVGATDGSPHPLSVAAFHSAKVHSSNGKVSLPLTSFRGAHISGGSVVWIVGDYETMKSEGYSPVGLELCGVGVSSDAHHLVTPTEAGPRSAILQALRSAGVSEDEIRTWDLHATGTPGDLSEVRTLARIISPQAILTARKGTFGHGLAAGGGWELTAQHIGGQNHVIFPIPNKKDEINHAISGLHKEIMCDEPRTFSEGAAGKVSMGVGGINACVISRLWDYL